MKALGERFVAIRKHLGCSQAEAGERVSVSKNSWQRFEAGDVPNGKTLVALTELGFSADWLLTGRGSMLRGGGSISTAQQPGFSDLPALELSQEGLDQLGYVLIPRYDVRAAAGGGAVIEDQNLKGAVAFKHEWLHNVLRANPADLLVVEAWGDSMPGVAEDGSLLLLDTSEPKFRGDGAYVFVVDDLLLVKNLRLLLDGSLEVTSTDEVQSTRDVVSRRDLDKVRIVGRVIWRAGRA